jgi:lipoate-protein ligase A
MEGSAKQKVPGGKLVYVRLSVLPDRRIAKAVILGDFFIYPENAIADIERSIAGISLDEGEGVFVKAIAKSVTDDDAELIGVTPEAIAKVIKSVVVT